MKTRKIVQMAIDFSSDSSCPPYIYALCNDGTLWGINDKPDEKWRPLPSIPQPPQCGEVEA